MQKAPHSIYLDTEGLLSILYDICYVIEKLTHLSLLVFIFLVPDLKLNLNLNLNLNESMFFYVTNLYMVSKKSLDHFEF